MSSLRAATVTKAVREAVNDQNVSLYQGTGYLYFVYDDGDIYETHSVMVYRINDMTLEQWVADGVAFVNDVKKRNGDARSS